MKCSEVRGELTPYHFGVISDDTRRDVEVHLLGCSACVKELVELKRAIELGEPGPAPGPAARARLRKAVARELGVRAPRREWSWWERPAAFALAGSAVLVSVIAMRVVTSGPGAPPWATSHEAAGSGAPGR